MYLNYLIMIILIGGYNKVEDILRHRFDYEETYMM